MTAFNLTYEKLEKITLILIGLSACFYIGCKLFFIAHYNINWDEFYFLSNVHDFTNSRLQTILQKGHVYLLWWLTFIPGNEITQIIMARGVMLCLQLLTAFFIFRISEFFFSRPASAINAFLYLSYTYVLWQGTSFRADPLAICLLMASLFLTLRYPTSIPLAASAGILIGIAGTITIKSIFIAIPIGIIACCLYAESRFHRRYLQTLFIIPLSALLIFTLYLIAQKLMTIPSEATVGGLEDKLSLFIRIHLLNGYYRLKFLFFENPILLSLLGLGLTIISLQLKFTKRYNMWEALMLFTLTLPLFTLFFYQNAYKYYYVFILAPAIIPSAAVIDLGLKHLRPVYSLLLITCLLGYLGHNIYIHTIERSQKYTLSYQQEIIETVHHIFPEPVPYIDRCGMISSYPRHAFFMSLAGYVNYKSGHVPDLQTQILEYEPKFILGSYIYPEQEQIQTKNILNRTLKDTDRIFIANHYIHHWNELYVAGKELYLTPENPEQEISIIISGPYTVESIEPILIDQKPYQNADIIILDRGEHTISLMNEKNTAITLRWGEKIPRPQTNKDIQNKIFYGF